MNSHATLIAILLNKTAGKEGSATDNKDGRQCEPGFENLVHCSPSRQGTRGGGTGVPIGGIGGGGVGIGNGSEGGAAKFTRT
jgi:hypothetical protein